MNQRSTEWMNESMNDWFQDRRHEWMSKFMSYFFLELPIHQAKSSLSISKLPFHWVSSWLSHLVADPPLLCRPVLSASSSLSPLISATSFLTLSCYFFSELLLAQSFSSRSHYNVFCTLQLQSRLAQDWPCALVRNSEICELNYLLELYIFARWVGGLQVHYAVFASFAWPSWFYGKRKHMK